MPAGGRSSDRKRPVGVHNGAVTLDPGAVRLGRVRGRYFRENFAQGGIDLVQIVPELVTNADAAIAASGRERGRIELALRAARRGVRCARGGRRCARCACPR